MLTRRYYKIDTKQLAKMLDGRKYGHEITVEEIKLAKQNNLVVVFGYSDDNMEFRGAIDDEVGCYDGGSVYITPDGLLENDGNCQGCKSLIGTKLKAHKLKAFWCRGEASWEYDIDVPFDSFDIMQDNRFYCMGIVFSMGSIVNNK